MITNEASLIHGCQKGDIGMQKALYENFAPKMLGICLRYTNDKEVARDLLQDGFIKVFTNFKMYKGTGSLEGWLRKVFVNTALEYLRKTDILRNSTEIDNFDQLLYIDADKSTLENLSASELIDIINELPIGYRTIFNLFAVEGYTHKEIAQLMNINESTSRSQYTRAKQMLQKRLASVTTDVRRNKDLDL